MSLLEGLLAVLGLTLITVLTRGFFFLSSRELPFPNAWRTVCAWPRWPR